MVRCVPDSVSLSDSEKSLLSKGLNFVPTTSLADTFQNQTDIQHFFRRLLLKAFFHFKDDNASEDSGNSLPSSFSKFNQYKSNFTPNVSGFPVLEHYFRTCIGKIDQLKPKPLRKHNLTPEERAALRQLKARTDIVIKPADKGGAVVAWDAKCYVTEGGFQLSNDNFYKLLTSNDTKNNQTTVKNFIKSAIDSEILPEEARS